jgi:hypothetical protein
MVTSESIISIRLAIPEDALLSNLFPSNNRWASGLLCRLLGKRIEAASITVLASSWGLPLNRSFYLFTVAQSPASPALAAVWAEITAVGLLAWAQIAWRAEDELSWRLFYPKTGIFAWPGRDEIDAESRIASDGVEAIRKLQERYGTSGA